MRFTWNIPELAQSAGVLEAERVVQSDARRLIAEGAGRAEETRRRRPARDDAQGCGGLPRVANLHGATHDETTKN